MEAYGSYNGTLKPLRELNAPVLDRAMYFGDGCYEAVLVSHGMGVALDFHLERFQNSLALLKIPFPLTRKELKNELFRCVAATEADEVLLYWQCTRGTARRTHTFPENTPPNLLIMATPKRIEAPSVEMKLISVTDVRFSLCHIKTLNLIPNVLAAEEAKQKGAEEAIFVRDGFVTEGTHTNVHLLKDGTLHTHPLNEHILPGVTRRVLLELCKQNGIPIVEQPFTLSDLKAADEVLITSSGLHVSRAVFLDGLPVGNRDAALYRRLSDLYFKKVGLPPFHA